MSLTGSVKLAVALERLPALPEGQRQRFYQIHRPVLATGAANGHRDITAVVPDECLQPVSNELFDVLEHVIDFRVRAQVAGNSLVLARQIAQA